MEFDSMAKNWQQTANVCPVCKSKLEFTSGVKVATAHGIKDNVVMCNSCLHVYQVQFDFSTVPYGMVVTKDVTEKYPQIKPKK